MVLKNNFQNFSKFRTFNNVVVFYLVVKSPPSQRKRTLMRVHYITFEVYMYKHNYSEEHVQ